MGAKVTKPENRRRHSDAPRPTFDKGSATVESSQRSQSMRLDSQNALRRAFFREYPSGTITLERFRKDWSGAEPFTCCATIFTDHIFRSFDTKGDGLLDFAEYSSALAVLQNGNRQEKEKWVFRLFDVNGDGEITRDEMEEVLQAAMPKRRRKSSSQSRSLPRIVVTSTNGEKSSASDRVMAIFDTMDGDRNGVISKREFMSALKEDPDLLKELVGHHFA